MGKEIAVELKNDVAVMGTLHSVDQYLNIKLLNVSVVEGEKFPQLVRSLRQQLASRRPLIEGVLLVDAVALTIHHWFTALFVQMNMKNCFIRGSSIRYVQIPAAEVDTELLQDAARREATANKQS